MTGDDTPIDGVEVAETPIADAADSMTPAPPATPPGSAPMGFGPPGPGSGAPGVVVPPADYTQAGVPSLDFVRDKIEGRYAQSLGSTELAQETPEARSFEEQSAKRADAAKEKLDEIRRSLRRDSSS